MSLFHYLTNNAIIANTVCIYYVIISSILVGPPYTFKLRVKFYSSEPNNLREELTRWLIIPII